MGWFDEDDDDEEDQEEAKVMDRRAATLHEAEEVEAEDPLDAYMKSLAAESNQNANGTSLATDQASVARQEHPQHRMDLEHEAEEKYSESEEEDKFQVSSTASSTAKGARTSRNKEVTNANGIIFHKAGEAQSVVSVREPHFWTSRDTSEGRSWRQTHHITSTKSVDPLYHWIELLEASEDWSNDKTRTIKSLVQHLLQTIPQPTPVQQQTIPILLQGTNAVVTAATGQGKTLAYLIPTLIRHRPSRQGLTVVLVPTRELALQVEKAAKPVLECLQGTCKSVIGGKESNYDVVKDLKRNSYSLIVASPGRLVDVTKKVSLQPTAIILDECDKLLQMGFEEQVRQLLTYRLASVSATGPDAFKSPRQMVLLSATLGKSVQQVANEWLGPHSVRIAVGRTGLSSQFVTQHVLVLANDDARTEFCVQMVPTFAEVGRILIFVATKAACETLAETIERKCQMKVAVLHGDKHQWDRTAALKEFTQGRVPVLVATDLASRGLDIPQVATVLCVHPAKNLDSHTHRIGRAGRLNHNQQQQGTAYSLLTPRDSNFARVLMSAWEREGRPVTQELRQLASASSKRVADDHSVGSRYASGVADSATPHRAEKKSRWDNSGSRP